jgi:hypothetical protein
MAKFTVQTKSLALGIFIEKKQHIKMISTDSASLIPNKIARTRNTFPMKWKCREFKKNTISIKG